MNDIDRDEFKEAWDRIARTADGQIVYRHLQLVRMGLAADHSDGALRHCEGRRSLAADLMAHMGKGIEESGGRNDTERPVVVSIRQPAIDGRRRTSARDWLRDHPDYDSGDRSAEPANTAGSVAS